MCTVLALAKTLEWRPDKDVAQTRSKTVRNRRIMREPTGAHGDVPGRLDLTGAVARLDVPGEEHGRQRADQHREQAGAVLIPKECRDAVPPALGNPTCETKVALASQEEGHLIKFVSKTRESRISPSEPSHSVRLKNRKSRALAVVQNKLARTAATVNEVCAMLSQNCCKSFHTTSALSPQPLGTEGFKYMKRIKQAIENNTIHEHL